MNKSLFISVFCVSLFILLLTATSKNACANNDHCFVTPIPTKDIVNIFPTLTPSCTPTPVLVSPTPLLDTPTAGEAITVTPDTQIAITPTPELTISFPTGAPDTGKIK